MRGPCEASRHRGRTLQVGERPPMLSPRSVRVRLLLAVNTAMGVLLLLFLVLDYQRELSDRVAEKRVALEEEAQTLLPGVLRLRPKGIVAVQDYVDSVCGTMRDRHSPGHHIAVRVGDTAVQAAAHHRASPEMLDTMEIAAKRPSREAEFAGATIVVGVSSRDDTTVYVSEQLTNVQRAVRRHVVNLVKLAGTFGEEIEYRIFINRFRRGEVFLGCRNGFLFSFNRFQKFSIQIGKHHEDRFVFLDPIGDIFDLHG